MPNPRFRKRASATQTDPKRAKLRLSGAAHPTVPDTCALWGSGREAFQERAGFGLAVATVGAVREWLECALGFLVSPETHQAECAIVACLGRKLAVGRVAQVGVPAGQRTRGIVIDEMRRVRDT